MEQVLPILKPYKLVSRELSPQPTVVSARGRRIGDGYFGLIAGPCSVEYREQTFAAARAVQAAGAMLRGGAFKPRSSPYAFQGLGQGLDILVAAREETGLPIVTELMDARHVEAVVEAADVIQIGARNMQNFTLLSEVGRAQKPVLLKRGPASSIEELLMAAEYIVSEGNSQVMLCERGIRTFERATRFTLDIGAVPVLKEGDAPTRRCRSVACRGPAGSGGAARAGSRRGGGGRDHRRGSPEPTRRSPTPRSRSRPTTSPPSRRRFGPRLAHGPCNRIAMRVAVVGTGLIGASIGLAAKCDRARGRGWDADRRRSRSPASGVPWTTLGRWGRRCVTPISPSWPPRSPRSRARSRPCSVWAGRPR